MKFTEKLWSMAVSIGSFILACLVFCGGLMLVTMFTGFFAGILIVCTILGTLWLVWEWLKELNMGWYRECKDKFMEWRNKNRGTKGD